jgi:hypothetical protein
LEVPVGFVELNYPQSTTAGKILVPSVDVTREFVLDVDFMTD